MSPHRELLLFCVVLLQLLQGCPGLSTVKQFKAAALCPRLSALPARAENSKIGCGAACSSRPDCDLFHFNRTAGLCYHGNSTCEGLALWSNGPCESYRQVPSSVDPIVAQLCLKLLYRFASHGLENVADPSKYRLSSGNATVNASAPDSFLMAETPGFETVVNKGNKFSFFVRAKHPLNIDATYAVFRQCISNNVSHDFFVYDGKIWHNVFWPAESISRLFRSDAAFNASSNSSAASIAAGVSFNSTTASGFYFNGNARGATLDETEAVGGLSNANFQCLHLGGFPEIRASLCGAASHVLA
uniref:Apple domain-containing protein n=1 Tax=Macrostomum lignano TaxID=282301 RepID=A0A1I8IAT5_9PLAT